MTFTEPRFLFFFLIVLCVYWGLRENQHRKFWLLVCSYAFYGAWDWRFLFLMLASTVVDYVVGNMLSRPRSNDLETEAEMGKQGAYDLGRAQETQKQEDSENRETSGRSGKLHPFDLEAIFSKTLGSKERQGWLLLSLVGNLGLLGFFKYYNFFIDSATNLLTFLGLPNNLPTLEIILPVGISFYTFQTLSYSIDVYRGQLKATKNFWDFTLFVSFFPQLVAGPIVRASTFLPELLTLKTISQVDIRGCLMLFLIGYIKKSCISDNLSPLVDQYFATPEVYTALSSWIAVVFFAIQLYCDFSGYSDMAIACAGLFGYKLPLNFNFPYFASNITEFWKRWHITLSTWIRDYLYIPLMQNREKKDITKLFSYSNLIITMLLCGLWHGAAWHFVIWGVLHGIAIAIHREWVTLVAPYKRLIPIRNILSIPLTFYWWCVSLIAFRNLDFNESLTVFKSFVFFNSPGYENLGIQAAWVLIPLAIVHWAGYKGWFADWWRRIPGWSFAAWYGLSVTSILPFLAFDYQPFVYFQF